MKILAIGRNYSEHIAELNHTVPDEPIVFTKPDTALLRNNAPFYYPNFSRDIHHEVELVLRICKEGKNIEEKFAYKYFEEIGLGIDFTARDKQKKLQSEGLPWDLAKGFNGSAPVSEFVSKTEFPDLKNINFSLKVNGVERQKGNSQYMIHSFERIISFISQYITLKNGDLIYTGTPAGVAAVAVGDRLEAFLEGRKMLDFEVK